MAIGKKTGGRKKGSVNKQTRALQSAVVGVAAKLADLGCDPIRILATIAMNADNEDSLRCRAAAELSQYVFPKLRSIEHSGLGGAPIEVNVSGLELLNSRISRIAERRREGGSS